MARWAQIKLIPSGARTKAEIFHCPRCSNNVFIVQSGFFGIGRKFLCKNCGTIANPPQPHEITGIRLN